MFFIFPFLFHENITKNYREYRKYKVLHKKKFLHDLDQELLKGAIYQNNEEMYSIFTRIFQNVLNKYAPLKQKKIRGNHAPFMIKDLSKAIMNKSKTVNRYHKWSSRRKFLAMKSAKNFCKNLIEMKKIIFSKVTQKDFANNKIFWNRIGRSRPEMLCKKGVLRNFAKFTEKHLCHSLFFNKVSKFLRTLFFTEHLRWLFLYNQIILYQQMILNF